jgi:L-seryl-tRNA(Ser) seleniumtransferase
MGIGHHAAVRQARELLDQYRRRGECPTLDVAAAALRGTASELVDRRLRRVVNATGILLHTNLGRAPLDDSWAAEAWGYGDVELDLASGERGTRDARIAGLARLLWDAPAALTVNNNAAALVLALRATAPNGVAVVSRGEAVQIGGGFRVPSIVEASGTRLVEVGTTNITTLDDYVSALDRVGSGAVLLRVHRSNFALEGHVEEPSMAAMAAFARERGVPLVVDQGSGACDALARALRRWHGARLPEPTVESLVAAGVTIVTFSGDKLLGGPQSGFLVGDAAAVARARKDPLARAFRLDKVRIGALEHVLGEWLRDEPRLPWLARLSAPVPALRERARALVATLEKGGVTASVEAFATPLGGGATPQWELPSAGFATAPADAEGTYRRLLAGRPAVVPRRERGRLLFDLRSVAPDEDALVAAAVLRVAGGAAP